MFLSSLSPRSTTSHLRLVPDLLVGRAREADGVRFGDAFEAGCDVDAIAHQIAVGLLDDVAEMNADAKLDALVQERRR